MSAQPFAVPCARCGNPAGHFYHAGAGTLAGLPDEHPAQPHDYAPDKSSVEWAAVKLREALVQGYLWAGRNCHNASIAHPDGRRPLKEVLPEMRAALEFAEVAGIKAEP